MDAPSGLMGGEGRQLLKSGPTRSAQTRSATYKSVPPWGQPAGVGTKVRLVFLHGVEVKRGGRSLL